jgi:hypothetical protein
MSHQREPSAREAGRCELCGREVAVRTEHHLIPRTRHRNKRLRRDFKLQEVQQRTTWLCEPCHKTVHATLSEKEIERQYNTLDALRGHPEIATFITWIQSHPATLRLPVRQTARRRFVRRNPRPWRKG